MDEASGPVTRTAVLLLGAHRSGTSALAGGLISLGLQGPKTLLPPAADNPLGYWESRPFIDFNERLLQSAQTAWNAWTPVDPNWCHSSRASSFDLEFDRLLRQEFGDAPVVVVKDPRMCRLVPFWCARLEAAAVRPAPVLILRHPAEAASSLAARDGFTPEHALLLWLRHVVDAEWATRKMTRTLVGFHDLLRAPVPILQDVFRFIGASWPADVSRGSVESLIRRDLQHHVGTSANLKVDPPLADWVTETHRAFEVLRDGSRPEKEAFETIDTVRNELDRTASRFGRTYQVGKFQTAAGLEHESRRLRELHQHAGTLEQQLNESTRELAGTRHQVTVLLDSMSWRVTAPLRALWRVLTGKPRGLG